MGAEVVGRLMPAIVTLDDLAAMNSADTCGHKYELTVTLYQLGPNAEYVEHAKMPLAWLLNTPAAEHTDR